MLHVHVKIRIFLKIEGLLPMKPDQILHYAFKECRRMQWWLNRNKSIYGLHGGINDK